MPLNFSLSAVPYLYFDESIRDNGGFIVGALILAEKDISIEIREAWTRLGLGPEHEYKSSGIKFGDPLGKRQRSTLRDMLQTSRLAFTVCPNTDRRHLGGHLVALVEQLIQKALITPANSHLFVDQNIHIPSVLRKKLASRGLDVRVDQDSCDVAGLQLADHAAHALGGMLLEELGVVRKLVKAGENSGYDPNEDIDLGFELWANLRYALLGHNEHLPGLSPDPEDPANPYFRVDGYGMYLPSSCDGALASAARARFGVNYLGCIH